MPTTPAVGTECRNCLGTGIPEHFNLHQPDGPVTCPPCGGTGQIKPRWRYLSPKASPAPVTAQAPLPAGVACLDCQRFGYAEDCPTCGGTSR